MKGERKMSTIFGITPEKMAETSSTFTVSEIYQQPATWEKTCRQIAEHKDEIQKFIDQVITCDDFDVVLTGAGTSEFVGNALFPHLTGLLNYKVKSYGTTDIVATPEAYLSRTKPTLLISFGRSGNSPESVGAIDAAESVCDNVYHLFVTCNKNGALSKRADTTDNCYAINLTDETHDQSFAMTSSFSNMYLATYLCFHLSELDKVTADVRKIIAAGQKFLDNNFFASVFGCITQNDYLIEPALVGSVKGHSINKIMLEYYNSEEIFDAANFLLPAMLRQVLNKNNMLPDNNMSLPDNLKSLQAVDFNEYKAQKIHKNEYLTLYPMYYFCPAWEFHGEKSILPETHAIHWCQSSWWYTKKSQINHYELRHLAKAKGLKKLYRKFRILLYKITNSCYF